MTDYIFNILYQTIAVLLYYSVYTLVRQTSQN